MQDKNSIQKQSQNIWSQFTKQYPLSKTLRFELKPEPQTRLAIERNQILERDKLIDDNYHKIKYYFDLLHREFIDEALKKLNLI